MEQTQHTDTKTSRLGILGKFALLTLIFSVVRGFVPILTEKASLAQPTYNLSFIMGILLSLFGIHSTLFWKSKEIPKQLRRLLAASLILNTCLLVPVLLLKPDLPRILMFAYIALFPFAIFGFTKISERQLHIALGIITLCVAGTVILDFIELNTTMIQDGIDLTISRHLLLRPDNVEDITTTADLLRPAGILGPRPHDSANLLAILSTLWVALLFRKSGTKTAVYTLSAISITALLMSQVASNILAFFTGILFLVITYRKTLFRRANIARITVAMLVGIMTVYIFARYTGMESGKLWQWSMRVSPTGDWAAMTSTGIGNIRTDLLAAFIGNSTTFGFSEVGNITESSFAKLLMELGIVPFAIFMMILGYPIRKYFSQRNQEKQSVLPYIAAVLTGFISLWHYGSLLRTTNEFVYLSLYARALMNLPHNPAPHALPAARQAGGTADRVS